MTQTPLRQHDHPVEEAVKDARFNWLVIGIIAIFIVATPIVVWMSIMFKMAASAAIRVLLGL